MVNLAIIKECTARGWKSMARSMTAEKDYCIMLAGEDSHLGRDAKLRKGKTDALTLL